MLEGFVAEKNGLAKGRITIRQLAETAGLSVATVDRVINGRRPVRRGTAARVQAAAESLGYHRSMSVKAGSALEPLRCAILLQKKKSFFYQSLAEELKQASQSSPGRSVDLTIEFMEDYLEPSKVAEQMRSMGERADALAVIAIDSPYISEVIDDLSVRQIPVVALLSDLSATNLAGYVGINNRIAGRTAAWAIARCARKPGSVGVLIGSHGYLGQEDREIGFRSYFREKRPDFKVLEPLICGDDTEIANKETLEMLKDSNDLVGLYSVGGGNRGTIRALEESRFPTKPAYVCHELTPPVRSGLIKGTVDFVLAHDLPQLARSSIQTFLHCKEAAQFKKHASLIPFLIYTSENA
jgi:LacI family transcriptional regulator